MDNPYQPPVASLDATTDLQAGTLATKWRRLFGAVIDTVCFLAIWIPVMMWLGYLSFDEETPTAAITLLIQWVIGFGIFLLLHGYLLYRSGQTIGKMLLRMRIVTVSGNPPTFIPLIVLRYMSMWVLNEVPVIGPLIVLVGYLMIFRTDRRCLHDFLAATKVVRC